MRYLPSAAACFVVLCCCLFGPQGYDSPPTGVAVASDRPSDEAVPTLPALREAASAAAGRASASDPAPSLAIKLCDERPRAGTRVKFYVETAGLDPETPLAWTLPQVDDEGQSFEAAIVWVDSTQREGELVWRRGGKYPLTVEVYLPVFSKDGQRIIAVRPLRSSVVLELAGGTSPTPDETPEPPAIADSLKPAFAPLALALAGKREEAAELTRIWSSLATVFERGAGKTLGACRQIHIDAAKYTAYGALAGKVPGAAAAIDTLWESQVGVDDVATTAEKRQAIVTMFRAMARTAWEAAR